MKIQLSQDRIAKDHLTVWQEAGPSVDLSMDLKALTFRPESIDEIVAYHVLDRMFPGEARQAITNWKNCLKKGGKLYILVDNFEYIARAFVGGDISIETFNENHSHASQYDQKLLGDMLIGLGFPEPGVKVWFDSIPDTVPRKHYELLIEATK